MKKNIFKVSAIVLIATASVFTGCKKDDTTAPVITLTGPAAVTVSLQGTYTEQNASATDDVDGAVTPTVSGTVNVNQTGAYTITYTATDAAGNSASATRTVTVVNDADAMTGTYSCTIAGSPDYTYTQMITASETLNNSIIFAKFGDYANNTHIHAEITGTNVVLSSQTGVGIGTAPNVADRTFAGQGAITSTGHFGLTYTEMVQGSNTINTVETFVKQ
jgi:hypothetical protein